MISCKNFYDTLCKNGISYFTGVPDSLLKDICAYISDETPTENHVIAANEGGAIGLAVGQYLATGNPALVYMQNSGFGNIVNPLLSIADPEVYGIPMLLIIGWRGEPGVKDEPQHVKQGRVNEAMLKSMEIPFEIVEDNIESAELAIQNAMEVMKKTNGPCALLIRKNTFEPYKLKSAVENDLPMSREDAIKCIIDVLGEDDIVVSTTGKASREVFEYRESLGQGHAKDFLTIGGMGHCSQIALGIAQLNPNRQVVCLDGDGAAIMHLGALAIIGSQGLKNFKHIIINNGAHDSVGGQPTVGFEMDFGACAMACGYENSISVSEMENLKNELNTFRQANGPLLLEIKVRRGARVELGRPTTSPSQNKDHFMKFLRPTVQV